MHDSVNKLPILLLGAGGHARACIDVIEHEGRFAVAGLVGRREEVGTRVLGYTVLGSDEDLPALLCDYKHALVTLGHIKTSEGRIRLFNAIEKNNGTLPVVVSPRAHVSRHATLGAGSIVMHGAIVNAGATIGRNCILNSLALVEHDAVVGDHCHVSTAAVINGGASIGAGTFIGSNSCVRDNIRIGDNCVIGMGQLVVADCAVGAWLPARKTLN